MGAIDGRVGKGTQQKRILYFLAAETWMLAGRHQWPEGLDRNESLLVSRSPLLLKVGFYEWRGSRA